MEDWVRYLGCPSLTWLYQKYCQRITNSQNILVNKLSKHSGKKNSQNILVNKLSKHSGQQTLKTFWSTNSQNILVNKLSKHSGQQTLKTFW